jgi:hypothetical protein
MANEVSGSLVNLKVRSIGETTWRVLVCMENSTFTITADIAERETNCGIITRPGIAKFSASGTAVQNASPTSSEAAYAYVKAALVAREKLEFQYISAADVANGQAEGDGINNFGNGYFNEVVANASAAADGMLAYDFTFTGTGTLDEFEDAS